MQRKDAIGKLFCRVCNINFQKRLGPLDKEVDVYCAWIDSAEQINSKGQKEAFGLMSKNNDSDSEDEMGAPQKKKVSLAEFDNDSDEETKEQPNPEMPNSAPIAKKLNSNPLSASEKIAELGLGQAAVSKTKIASQKFNSPVVLGGGLGQAVKKQSYE